MTSKRTSLLSLALLGLGFLQLRAADNTATAKGNVPIRPIRQQELDPTVRKGISRAGAAQYITPAEQQRRYVEKLETNAQEATQEHRAFVQEHECTPESFQVFSRQVQPILLNSCGTGACHGGDKGGEFTLQRPRSNAYLTPNVTRQNLVKTLELIDKNEPEISPLLRQALLPHGGGSKPPLNTRKAPAYQALEAWVMQTARPKSLERSPPAKQMRDAEDLSEADPATATSPEEAPDVKTNTKGASPNARQVPIRTVKQDVLDSGKRPEADAKDGEEGAPKKRPSFFGKLFDRR